MLEMRGEAAVTSSGRAGLHRSITLRLSLVLAVALALPALTLAPPARAAGETLVWGDTVTDNLDPHMGGGVPDQFVLLNVYDNLYRYQGPEAKIVPWLATAHRISEDAKTYEFDLRPGVKFHDGSPLTADEVVYSFKRALGLAGPPVGPLRPVLKADNVRATGPLKVSFTLEQPYAPFLSVVPLIAIVNPRVVDAHQEGDDRAKAWLSTNSAGSGAYVVTPGSFKRGQGFEMTRFADHFMGWAGNPQPIDTVRARAFAETSTRTNALIKGEVQAGDGNPAPDQIERLKKAKGITILNDESMRVFVIRMHNKRPPFDNVNVRHCFSHAFNYDGFIKTVLLGAHVRNPTPLPQNMWGLPKDVAGYAFDLEKAKAECDKARAEGAPLDREIELHTLNYSSQTIEAAQMFQSDLRRIGVKLKLVPSTWALLTASGAKQESTPDLWIHWMSAYFVDPENWLGQMYDTHYWGTWRTSSWYSNAKVDDLLGKARAETNQAQRAPLYQEATRLIVADAPDIWVYNTVQNRAISSRLKGVVFSPVGSGNEIRTMHLAQR